MLRWPEEYTQATSSTATGTLNVRGIDFSEDVDFFRRCRELFCKLSPPAVSKHIQISLDVYRTLLSYPETYSDMQRPSTLIQRILLDFSPKAVVFVSKDIKVNRQSQVDEVLRGMFPTLFQRNLAKTVFNAGA